MCDILEDLATLGNILLNSPKKYARTMRSYHVMLLPYDLLGIYGRKKLAQQDNNKKQNRVSFMAHMKLK